MFKILDEACIPSRGSKYSACVDLRAREDISIEAGKTVIIPLGVCIDIDDLCVEFKDNQFKDEFLKSHYLQLMLRSSLGKKGLILPNGVGVIDLDYKNEIMMIVHNSSKGYGSFKIEKGERVGQITMIEHKSFLFDIESDEERVGGFGSTNKKEVQNG